MRIAILALLLSVTAQAAIGQATDTTARERPAAEGSPGGAYNDPLTKSAHLEFAAEHLAAAGYDKEAEEIRGKAIAAFLAELLALEKAAGPRVQLNVCIMEFSRTKLRDVDSSRYGGKAGVPVLGLLDQLLAPIEAPEPKLEVDAKLLALIAALRRDKLIVVRSEPSVDAVPDRPGWLLNGGEVGYNAKDEQGRETIKYVQYGTRLDWRMRRVSSERIKLDLKIGRSEVDGANSIDGVPALKTREFEIGVNLRLGKTIGLCGLTEKREIVDQSAPPAGDKPRDGGQAARISHHHIEEIEMLFLLTPTEAKP